MELLRRTLILNESANKNSQQIPDELAIPPPRGVLHENYYNLWLELSKKENQEVPLPTYSSVVANGSTSMEAFSSPTEVRGERCVT